MISLMIIGRRTYADTTCLLLYSCLTCRRRKTRCAGERPLCSTCTKNGHRCLGYPEDTKKDINGDGHDVRHDDTDDLGDDDSPVEEESLRPRKFPSKISVSGHTTHQRASVSPPMSEAAMAVSPTTAGDLNQVRHNQEQTRGSPSYPTLEHQQLQRQHSQLSHGHQQSRQVHTQTRNYLHRQSRSRQSQTLSPGSERYSRQHTQESLPKSPSIRRNLNNRVPYFRYFGPTAIVPGYKQMVVSVRDRRRSGTGSQVGASPISTTASNVRGRTCSVAGSEPVIEEIPFYEINDPNPVHPLILSLCTMFFTHVGCNYPFLKQSKFMILLKEKRVETILVDAICAIAARFSDSPILTGGNEKMPRNERSHTYAQRAKAATVDTFPCPSVGAVQACLLMAYEGFGANQDSALWMYLGLAIRMAVDLGLQKRVGIQYQGDKDPWYVRQRSLLNGESESPEESHHEDINTLTLDEQREVEQERIDTFWAVFVLDRAISSGTGRPVTLRDDDFELAFPEATIDSGTGFPSPFPTFLEIIHLYGRVCDVLNNIRDVKDMNQDRWDELANMENQLTKLYKGWDERLQFNVTNFRTYLSIGQGPNFILLHFWFHALFIILHQPTLMFPFGELNEELQLLPDSRELSMSSAKTICDILAFADLIDPKSFIGNPFTSQPMYIAACAFLMESTANTPIVPSREPTPMDEATQVREHIKASSGMKNSRYSLLASAANQNYQRCYNSLQQLHTYWGGVKYILTALDQKCKGIWDCETYTTEEYESTKRNNSLSADFPRFDTHPSPQVAGAGPPIAWSLAGTGNSPNSNLTLMYQNSGSGNGSIPNSQPQRGQQTPSTPPGNMVYDPIRQSLPPEAGGMYPPSGYPQGHHSHGGGGGNGNAHHSPSRRPRPRRLSNLSGLTTRSHPTMKFEGMSEEGNDNTNVYMSTSYTPTSTHSSAYDAFGASPSSTMADVSGRSMPPNSTPNGTHNMYYANQGVPYEGPWGGVIGNMNAITFDSQDIDINTLGLQQPDLMSGWLEYIPTDVMGMFEHQNMHQATQ